MIRRILAALAAVACIAGGVAAGTRSADAADSRTAKLEITTRALAHGVKGLYFLQVLTASGGPFRTASLEEMAAAARKIHSQFGCAVLLKGGHLQGVHRATDIFFDGKIRLALTAPFVKGIRTHGTGCVYSAAICAALALGQDLPHAVQMGKRFVTAAIQNSCRIGEHFALGTPKRL